MPEDKLKQLFTTLQSDDNYDVGDDYNAFKSALDEEKSKQLFDALSTDDNYDVGKTYDEFSTALDLKKKEQSELSSMVSEDTWSQRLNSLREPVQSESPLPSQDQPNPSEPPKETAKTVGEWITSSVGELNKAAANTLNKLDYVQATAGQAVNQILFGKEMAEQMRVVRDAGGLVNPVLGGTTPFKAAAEALEYASSGTKDLPDNVGGNIAKGVAQVIPDILTTLLLPEVKGAMLYSKFGAVLGGKGFIEGMQNAQTTKQQLTVPFASGAEGYMMGLLFDGFGKVSSSVAQRITTKVLPQATASIGLNSLLFGGYGTAEEYLRTGQTTSNTFFTNVGMGIALGAKEVGNIAFAKGMSTLMSAPKEAVKRIAESDVTAEQLRDNGVEKMKGVEDGTSVDKEGDLATAAMNINASHLKATIEEIKANPEEVSQTVKDSTIPAEMKEAINTKINEFVADNDPRVQEAKPITSQIKKIEAKIAFIKQNESLSAVEKDIQTQSLNKEVDVLRQEVERIYGVNDVKEGDKVQTVGDLTDKSVKGALTKTKDGFEITDDLMGIGKSTPLKSVEDVVVLRESTSNELQEVTKELENRSKIDDASPYRIAGKTYDTKESFIEGLKELASSNAFDTEIVMSPDLKSGDVSLGEVQKILQEYSPKEYAGAVKPDVSLTATTELEARADMLNRRIERLNKAEELLQPKGDVKDAENSIKKDEVEQTTTQGEIVEKTASGEAVGGKESTSSLAAMRSTDIVFSLDPKVEELKIKLEEAKKEPKRMTQMIDAFLKENSEAINAAQIKVGDIRALRNANTWAKVAKAVKNMSARLKENSPRYRADNLLNLLNIKKDIREQVKAEAVEKGLKPKTTQYNNYVKEQMAKRNPFQNIPEDVYINMVKKATEASMSDTKLRQAEEYIDKAMIDAAFVKEENARLGLVTDVVNAVKPKALLQKGSRGGDSPKLKKKYLAYDGHTENVWALQTIHDLITKGSSKDYPNPLKVAEANEVAIQELREKKVTTEEEYKENERKIDELLAENEILEYTDIANKETWKLKEMLENVQRIDAKQQTRARESRAKMKEFYTELIRSYTEEDAPSQTFVTTPKGDHARGNDPSRTLSTVLLENTNLFSLMNLISSKSAYVSDKLPIMKDRLNEHYMPKIFEADNLYAEREIEATHDWIDGMAVIYGKTKGALEREIIDLVGVKNIEATVKTVDGDKSFKMTPDQAIQKLLQWRDVDGRRSMEKVINKDNGMGFTEKTIKQIESQLTPEQKNVMSLMQRLMGKYSQIYDKAYIRENGVSMIKSQGDYWPLTKKKSTSVKEEIGSFIMGDAVTHDRTIRRTKDSYPLKYGSAVGDMIGFMNEAMMYEAYAQPVRELQYFFKDPKVRESISQNYGSDAARQMDNNIRDIAGNLRGFNIKWIDALSGNYAGGTLGFKALPVINQAAAMVYFQPDMTASAFAEGLKNAFTLGKLDATNESVREFLKKDIVVRERRKQTKMLYGEELKSIGLKMVEEGANVEWAKTKTRFPIAKKLKEYGGIALREGDLMPIVGMGSQYVEYKYKQHSGKKLTKDVVDRAMNGDMDANFQRAIEDWRIMTIIGQQSLRKSNRSKFSQGGTFHRAAVMFTSGQLSGHRITSSFLRDSQKHFRNGDRSQGYEALKSAVIAHSLSGAVFGLIDGIVGNKFGDEGETTGEKIVADAIDIAKPVGLGIVLGNLEGLVVLGRLIAMAKNQWLDKPYAKNGKAQLMPFLTNLENFWKNATRTNELLTASVLDEAALQESMGKLAVSVSKFSGVPADGMLKLITGAIGAIEDTNDPMLNSMENKRAGSLVSWELLGITQDKDAAFRPIGETSIGMYKNFDEAKQDAKRYMAFHEGGLANMLGREGFEVDVQGMKDFIMRAAASGVNTDPQKVLVAAFNDIMRERMRRLYGLGSDLNTIQEIKDVLAKNDLMPMGDREAFNTLLDKIMGYDVKDAEFNAIDKLFDLQDKIYDLGVPYKEKGDKDKKK